MGEGGVGGGGGHHPPHHLDEEIYTEICANNHAVRHVLNNSGGGDTYSNNDQALMTTLPIGATINQATVLAGKYVFCIYCTNPTRMHRISGQMCS